MATNGSRRRNHGWKKHGTGGNQGTEGERDGRGEREDEGEDKKGARGGYDEATEEKTRLHVTSSPKSIWSQSVFHYQKPRRALYQIVHSATLVKLTEIPRTHREDREVAHN